MKSKDKEKKPVWYSSRFWVAIYAIVVAVIFSLQLLLGLLDKFEIQFRSIALNKFVNGQVVLPIEAAAWSWTALISLFCGFDRFVDIKTTMSLSAGQMSLGDLKKLRIVILETLFLFIFALGANFIVDKDFQLTAMFSAFAMSVIIYVAGNKLVKSQKYTNGMVDADQDGIPDEIQHAYEKWVRAQKKEGVNEVYINLDYFLDENPEYEQIIFGEAEKENSNEN